MKVGAWDAVLWIVKLYIPPPLGDEARMFRFHAAQSIGVLGLWVVVWTAGLWLSGKLPIENQIAWAADVKRVNDKVDGVHGEMAPVLVALKEIRIAGLRSNISEQVKYQCNAKRAKNQLDLDQANDQITKLTDQYFALTQRQLKLPSCDTGPRRRELSCRRSVSIARPYPGKSMSVIALLVLLIIFCAIVWAARAILNAFAIPDPLNTVIWVVIVLICLAALLSQAGLFAGPGLRLH